MKNFLSKNWKRILILIAGIFIAVNIFHKVTAPRSLVSEFTQYGPDVENTSTLDIHPTEVMNEVRASAPVSDDVFRILMVLVIGIFAALVISDLANKKPAAKKK